MNIPTDITIPLPGALILFGLWTLGLIAIGLVGYRVGLSSAQCQRQHMFEETQTLPQVMDVAVKPHRVSLLSLRSRRSPRRRDEADGPDDASADHTTVMGVIRHG